MGYAFGRGSYNISREQYEAAVARVTSAPLASIAQDFAWIPGEPMGQLLQHYTSRGEAEGRVVRRGGCRCICAPYWSGAVASIQLCTRMAELLRHADLQYNRLVLESTGWTEFTWVQEFDYGVCWPGGGLLHDCCLKSRTSGHVSPTVFLVRPVTLTHWPSLQAGASSWYYER